MKRHYLFLLALLVVALAVLLPGCASGQVDLDGMYVATFELNGGKLDLKSTSVDSNINYAYDPGSHIIDPTCKDWNYKLTRPGYIFTGWYTSAECRENEKWNFATDTIEGNMTLHAGWEKEIVFSFSVCYLNGETTEILGQYKVSAGDEFEDYRKYANKRDGFTALGYYSDAECTTPLDFSTKHPGGDADTDIKVYVDFIPGDWIIVDSFNELKNAVGKGNIYLTGDIDCEGQVLSFGRSFGYTLEGNGYAIRNFTVEKSGGALMPGVALFQSLTAGAKIQNVSFENVTFEFFGVKNATKIKVAALAKEATDCFVSNVTITGTIKTDYTEEFPRLNEAFFEETDTVEINGEFKSEITVSVETES